MANYVTKFIDPAGSYTGGYTSNTIKGNSAPMSNIPNGVVQINIVSGTVTLEMRLSEDAPWVGVKTYTASAIDEIVIANYLRVVATGDAEAWLGETL